MAAMPQLPRREANKQRKKIRVGSEGWRRPPEFLESTPPAELKEIHLAFRRDVLREDTPWDGASAVPAGGFVTRSRAASGIILPAQRPACEVLAVRGQSFVFPARVIPVEKRKVSASRLRRPYRTERSGLLLGSMAWCRALGTSCLPGQSRSGTPRGELPPPYPSPASGGGSGWGQPRARKARVRRRVSRRSASPFVCGLGGHREKPRNGAEGKALEKMVG